MVVGLSITLAVALAGVIVLLIQWKVGFELRPFLLVWGLLLAPTVMVWTALVLAIHTITQNRYTTYALCLGVLCFTGYRALTNQINWVGNWPLWQSVALERYQRARARPAGPGAQPRSGREHGGLPGGACTVLLSPSRPDAARILHRLSPLPLFRSSLEVVSLDGDPARCRDLAGTRSELGP